MRVRAKLVAMTLFVAVVPLAMSASQSIALHESALDQNLLELHAASAAWGAQALDLHLAHAEASFQATVSETIDWASLTDREREAALWLLYGQFPASAVVSSTRRGITTQHVFSSQASPRAPDHPLLSARDVAAFDSVAPPAQGEVSVGAAMRTEAGDAILPLSLTEPGTDNQPSTQISLGLSLAPLCAVVGRARPDAGSLLLLDAWNREVCEDGRLAPLSAVDGSLASALAGGERLYSRAAEDGELRGAVVTGRRGFRVVVEQPLAVLHAARRELRWRVLMWLAVGVVAALGSGWVLARGILVPLEALTTAARSIAQGELEQKLSTSGADELSELADAFNTMSAAIVARDAEITRWNATLQARVEERGRQLEQAHDALLRAEKMAGLAVTTAGVAHEMNNPLTGVLGFAQLLEARLRQRQELQPELIEMASAIGTEARRMQQLLLRMGSLDADDTGDNLRNVALSNVLEEVLLAYRSRIEECRADVIKRYPAGATVLGDPYKLHSIFDEILDNALKAVTYCEAGVQRTIDVSVSTPGRSWIEATFTDNGCGIEEQHLERVFEPFFTTKMCERGEGLGLTRAYHLVRAMGGAISVRRALERGTQVAVRLPAGRAGALLA